MTKDQTDMLARFGVYYLDGKPLSECAYAVLKAEQIRLGDYVTAFWCTASTDEPLLAAICEAMRERETHGW